MILTFWDSTFFKTKIRDDNYSLKVRIGKKNLKVKKLIVKAFIKF